MDKLTQDPIPANSRETVAAGHKPAGSLEFDYLDFAASLARGAALSIIPAGAAHPYLQDDAPEAA